MDKTTRMLISLATIMFLTLCFATALVQTNHTSGVERSSYTEVESKISSLKTTNSINWEYSTYFGGQGDENCEIMGTTFDEEGNVIFAGQTTSTDFPTLTPFQESYHGSIDGFVAKFDSSNKLIFSTYIGGSDTDWCSDVAIDSDGNIVVTGSTESTDFPLHGDCYQSTGGYWDVFVAKISPEGQLIFSSSFGGEFCDQSYGVATNDKTGEIVITGWTHSTQYPTTAGAYQMSHSGGVMDAFITKLSSDGKTILYSTFFGGSATTCGCSVALDSKDNIIIAGGTDTSEIPIKNAYQDTYGGLTEYFITKFNDEGQLIFSTFLGGSAREFEFEASSELYVDEGISLNVDTNGNIIVAAHTASNDFPVTENAFQDEVSDLKNAFVTKYDINGSVLFSTFLGGSDDDGAFEIEVIKTGKNSGNFVITGETNSADFPVTTNAIQSSPLGDSDAFVSYFHSNGSLIYSSFIGGSNTDTGKAITINANEEFVVIGCTYSEDFPTLNSYQTNKAGLYDLFIFSFNIEQPSNTSSVSETSNTTNSSDNNTNSTNGFELLACSVLFSITVLIRRRKVK